MQNFILKEIMASNFETLLIIEAKHLYGAKISAKANQIELSSKLEIFSDKGLLLTEWSPTEKEWHDYSDNPLKM